MTWSLEDCCGERPSEHGLTYQNGAAYLVVDDSCHYWSYEASGGRVRSGSLSENAQNEWESLLGLNEFLDSPAVDICRRELGGAANFRFRGKRARMSGGCNVDNALTSSGIKLGSGVDTIRAGIVEGRWEATTWTGAMRYILVRDGSANGPGATVQWPLSISPNSVAVRIEDTTGEGWKGAVRYIEGMESDALRRVRDEYLLKRPGADLIPIADHFHLSVRDTIPIEADDGSLAF